MMPVGPLMIEHRLIERMIKVMEKEIVCIEHEKSANPVFIDTIVDFIRTYADRCHHGKEEGILFRELRKKPISGGDKTALPAIVGCMKDLTGFYLNHIKREDKGFFLPGMGYFSHEEKDAMLAEGFEFDRNLIHEKYRDETAKAEKLFP